MVRHLTLVDEMRDGSLMGHRRGVALETGETRRAKEDMDRVKGERGAVIAYNTPEPIKTCRVYAFFPQKGVPLAIGIGQSSDGQIYEGVRAESHRYFSGEGEYGYFWPVLFETKLDAADKRHIVIRFLGEAQISRVEITYGGPR